MSQVKIGIILDLVQERYGLARNEAERQLSDWQRKVSGAWVLRDTRMPVATIIENLEDLSVEEVMEQFDVTREQIEAVRAFAAQRTIKS